MVFLKVHELRKRDLDMLLVLLVFSEMPLPRKPVQKSTNTKFRLSVCRKGFAGEGILNWNGEILWVGLV